MSDQLKGMKKELRHLEDEIKKSEKLNEQLNIPAASLIQAY